MCRPILLFTAWEETYYHANFEKIEALVADRPYSMIAGHQHNYQITSRHGRDYIRMGTVGAGFHHEGSGNGPRVLDYHDRRRPDREQ